MATEQAASPSKAALWGGRVLSALPVLALLGSGFMKVSHNHDYVETMVGKLGYPEGPITAIGIAELISVVLYAVPQTAVLGAVLLTGYLGGAVATHVRIGEGVAVPVIMGMVVWAGLFLRDPRVRALLPLRKV